MNSDRRRRFSLLVSILASAVPAAAQVKKEAVKEASVQGVEGRVVGGTVKLVQACPKPLVECAVSDNGAVSVRYAQDTSLHVSKLSHHFASDSAGIEKNDSAFAYKIRGIRLAPDGERIFGMIDASTLAIVRPPKTAGGFPKILHHLRGMPGLESFDLHPKGIFLAAGMHGGIARIWNTETGKPIRYVQAHDKDVTWLGFTPDGAKLVTAAKDGLVRFHTFPDGQKIHEVKVDQPVQRACFVRDGKSMVSFESGAVRVWDLGTMSPVRKFAPPGACVLGAVSADGKTIAIALADGTVGLHDAVAGRRRHSWKPHPGGGKIVCLKFVQPAGRKPMLVTGAASDDMVFWDLAQLDGGATTEDAKKSKRATRRKR